MRLSIATDYAMRLLMYVGEHEGRLCTIAEVARAYDISEAHLMKVTHELARLEVLETQRGRGGGMRLARKPADINLGTLVRAMEPDLALVECLGESSACRLTGRCRLTAIIRDARADFLARLDRHSLADIMLPAGRAPWAAAPASPSTRAA